MKILVLAAAVLSSSVALADTAPRSDVEARLDALEKINVTAFKPAQASSEAVDPQIDAIVQRAADAERDADRAETEQPSTLQ